MPLSASPSALEAVRRDALGAVLEEGVGIGGVLFELDAGHSGAAYRPTSSLNLTNPLAGEIPPDSLLIKWMRVNRGVLPYPDASGIAAGLTEPELTTLDSLGVGACLPLIHEHDLVGWVGFVPAGPGVDPAGHARRQLPKSGVWASRLRGIKLALNAERRAETFSRSNRLSVTGHLAATIAHEVRNPLAAARSIAQLIRQGEAPAGDHDRLLGNMIEEIDRATELLSQVLTFGRSISWVSQACDLGEVVSAGVDFCRPYAARRGQRILFESLDGARVRGDSRELRQVVVNLVLNACQSRGSGGDVHVRIEQADSDRFALRVVDRGDGMTPETLARAFEPFYSTKPEGGGLGLAICREVIQRHGGVIGIESRPGSGTEILVLLPGAADNGPHSHR